MNNDEQEYETILPRPAKSGRLDYGSPVILHESSKRRLVLVPFFIPRSDHKELAVKLQTFNKTGGISLLVDDKSISLREDTSRKLLHALQTHLEVAETGADGSYIVVKISEGTANLGSHDPSKVAQALTKVLSQPEIVEHLKQTELNSALLDAFRGAIRLSEMRTAVATLREKLNSEDNEETTYQKWCENHSWAFGNAYVVNDKIRHISTGDRLDILLPTDIARYRDLVELKRPDKDVLFFDASHRNHYFSTDVSKAIGQCHRYLDILHEVAANGLLDHPEIVAYHPKATIVIGRSANWPQEWLKALRGLNGRLSCITVMTYDQLLAQGERLVQMLSPGDAPTVEVVDELLSDDDIPF